LRPPEPLRVKVPPPPKVDTPRLPEVKLDVPKINMPKIEDKPDLKPIQIKTNAALPTIKEAKPAIFLAPQPKSALTAATPAQVPQLKPSVVPVHLGETFGVTPNPDATRPATVAAIGNPYKGMEGPVVAPHGMVGSTSIGKSTGVGSNMGTVGKAASAGIPGAGIATTGSHTGGKVAAAGIPTMQTAVVPPPAVVPIPHSTNLEIISKPPVQYTGEARALRVAGDVVLRVTFTATGQVLVKEVLHGLGHGLDEEARRVAQQIRFHPATRNGQGIDLTTNITITFQLA
jgi:TonB family protein